MFNSIRKLITISGALLVCAAAFAGDLKPVQQYVEGHFLKREFRLNPELPENFGKPFMDVISEGTGVTSGMGKTYVRNEYILRLVFGPGGQILIKAEGTWLNVAANGDEIRGDFVLYRPLDSLEATFDYVITSGTGRFANATGHGSGHSIMSADEESWASWSEGVGSTVGANKK